MQAKIFMTHERPVFTASDGYAGEMQVGLVGYSLFSGSGQILQP